MDQEIRKGSSIASERPSQGPFLADHMLIRLARWLRLAGHNVENPPPGGDEDLLRAAEMEGRTLLTRDRALAQRCMRSGGRFLLIKSSDLDHQLAELARAGVDLRMNPKRCTLCNGRLLNAGPGEDGRERWRCERCKKLYWRGSHWERIRERLETLSESETR